MIYHSWILGVWIVALMESLASRGEFMILRDIADENTYKGNSSDFIYCFFGAGDDIFAETSGTCS